MRKSFQSQTHKKDVFKSQKKNIKIFCLACASAYQAQKDSTMARQVKAAYRASLVCVFN